MKKYNRGLSMLCSFVLIFTSVFCAGTFSIYAEEDVYDTIYSITNEYVQAKLNESTAEGLLAEVQKILPGVTLNKDNDYFIKHAVPGVTDNDTTNKLSIPGSDGAVSAIFGYNSHRIGISVGFSHNEEIIDVSDIAVVGKSSGFSYDKDGNVTGYSGSADKIVFPTGYAGTMTEIPDKSSVNNVKVVIINNNVILHNRSFADWASLNAVQFGPEVFYIFQSNIGSASFTNCPNLKYVKLPNTHGRDGYAWWSITTNSLFENCTHLENLILPKNIEQINLSQGYRAFYNTAVRDFFLSEYMIISNNSYDSPYFSNGTRNVITYDTDMTFVRAAALAQAAATEAMRNDNFSAKEVIESTALNAISGSHDAELFRDTVTCKIDKWETSGSILGGKLILTGASDTITLNCTEKNHNDVMKERVQKAVTKYVEKNKNDSTLEGLLNAVKAVNETATLSEKNYAIYYSQPCVSDKDTKSGYQLNIGGNDGAVAATFSVTGFDISCACSFEREHEVLVSDNIAVAGADDGKLNYDDDGNIIGCNGCIDKIILPPSFTGTFSASGTQSLSTVKTVIIRNTVSIIRNAFSGSDERWNSLKALDINANNEYYRSGTDILKNANVNNIPNLKYVALPRCLDNNTIGNNSFQNLPSLSTVNVPVFSVFNNESFYNTGIREFILSAKSSLGWGNATMLNNKNFDGGKTVSIINDDTAVTDARAVAWIAATVSENSALNDNDTLSCAKAVALNRAWNEVSYNYFNNSSINFENAWMIGNNGVDTRDITISHASSVFKTQIIRTRISPKISMNDGVNLCTDGGYGLSFDCTITGLQNLTVTGATCHVGTIIVPIDYLNNIEFTAAAFDNANLKYIDVPITVYKQTGSSYVASAAITNIKSNNYNREFVARSYAEVTYKDGAIIRYYADYSLERNADSVYNTAIKLLNNGENPVTDKMVKKMLESYVDTVNSKEKSIMYVNFNAYEKTFNIVQNYSANENMVIVIKPTGINKILNFAPPKFIENTTSNIATNISSSYERSGAEGMSESDWLGPHYIDYSWFGGTHGTNGEGGKATAFMDNIQINLDGQLQNSSESLAAYAASFTITWDTYAGATNKMDYYVLEHHTIRFDGTTWHIHTNLEFNKDCLWIAYYGIQAVYGVWGGTTGVISYDGGESISLNGSNGYSTTSSGEKTETMVMCKNSDCVRMYMDNGYGLGTRSLCNGLDGAFTVTYNDAKNGKAYFRLVDNANVKKGDTYGLNGSYTFYSTKSLDDKIFNRSIVNQGNAARIAETMKKARNGEAVTVGVIGGSITQGTGATSSHRNYANIIKAWWKAAFPHSVLTFINVGKGDTTSLMGVARVEEDLLCYNPDFIIAEFSVNDPIQEIYGLSYEGLARKILNSTSRPGLLLLQTMNSKGENCADYHTPVGINYNLPVISYKEALWPTGSICMYNWSEISNDSVHPNNLGHSILARLVTHYLENVKSNLDCYHDCGMNIENAYNSSNMENAIRYNHNNFTPTTKGIFEDDDNTFQLGNGWTATGSGDAMTFTEKDAKQIYIVYYWDASGNGGQADVTTNGANPQALNGDFTGGWNRLEVHEVLNTDEPTDCTVNIKPTSASGKKFTICGIIVSR